MTQEFVTINGIELPVLTIKNKKVLFLGYVPSITDEKMYHSLSVTLNRDIKLSDEYKRFTEGEDYYVIKSDELAECEGLQALNVTKNFKKVLLITKKGLKKITPKHYKALVKYFTAKPYTKEEENPIIEDKVEPIADNTTTTNEDVETIKAEIILVKQKNEELVNIVKTLAESQTKMQNAVTEFIQIQTKVVTEMDKAQSKSLEKITSVITTTGEHLINALADDDSIHINGNGDYDEFCREIKALANDVYASHKDKYKDRNEVLSVCYEELRKVYGVVWEQDKHNFKTTIGRSPMSNLELVWWIEGNINYRDLCKNKLLTMKMK